MPPKVQRHVELPRYYLILIVSTLDPALRVLMSAMCVYVYQRGGVSAVLCSRVFRVERGGAIIRTSLKTKHRLVNGGVRPIEGIQKTSEFIQSGTHVPQRRIYIP